MAFPQARLEVCSDLVALPGEATERRHFFNSMRTTSLPFFIGAALHAFFGSIAFLSAQAPIDRSPDLPPVPEKRILDPARVFTFEPEVSGQLADMLHNALTVNEIDVYVAAYSFLLDEPVESRATRLAEHWITHPKGLVIVYVRSGDQISYAASPEFKDFIPKNDLDELFLTAAMGVKDLENPAQRIAVATEQFLQSIDERLHSAQETRSFLHRDILLLAAVAFILAAIIGKIAWHLFTVDRQPRKGRRFPSVTVGNRFGASHGGGVLTESSYGNSPNTNQPLEPRS